MIDYLSEAKEIYYSFISHRHGEPKGVTSEQIIDFELRFQVKLPEAYKQFLLWMGDDRKGVFKGSNWFFEDILENEFILREILEDNNLNYIDDKRVICFFSHQGYMASWFYIPCESENPECYFIKEEAVGVSYEAVESFVAFLCKDLKTFVQKQA